VVPLALLAVVAALAPFSPPLVVPTAVAAPVLGPPLALAVVAPELPELEVAPLVVPFPWTQATKTEKWVVVADTWLASVGVLLSAVKSVEPNAAV
jgi:hypothetical protein